MGLEEKDIYNLEPDDQGGEEDIEMPEDDDLEAHLLYHDFYGF